jgi:hypothetical protein
VAAVGGQHLLQHAPSEPQQSRADHLLGGFQPGIAAAQDPGCLAGEPS